MCAGLTACGPFGYLKQVSRDASRAVAEAEAAGAEELAPYEYWSARAYLEQAQVLAGYSEYERAFDYGNRATQLADQAKAKSTRVDSERREKKLEEINAQAVGQTDGGDQ